MKLAKHKGPLVYNTYSHGGDLGDIIYALPTIKIMGGGILRIPYDCTWPIREKMTPPKYKLLHPILKAQPYIISIEWGTKHGTIQLDRWRSNQHISETMTTNGWTLCDVVAISTHTPHYPQELPWLTCPTPTTINPTIIARSTRYNDTDFNWPLIYKKYAHTATFIGLQNEYDAWIKDYGPIKYHPTPTLWELFCIIAGAKTFIGNQSFPMSLAIGLGVPTIMQAVSKKAPNCQFNRPGLTYTGE